MTILARLKRFLPGGRPAAKDTDPVRAYNLWSQTYDAQPDNLMLHLDNMLFSSLIADTALENRVVVDVGCGTGRHWGKMLSLHPVSLSGYDVSLGMLNKLREKYPEGKIYQLQNNLLPDLKSASCDIIVSTLTIAHIEHIEEAFSEWNRVLKPGGEIIITDYHPEAFVNGANRTFSFNGQLVSIKNYIHKIDMVTELFGNLGMELLTFREHKIDASVRNFYEKKSALHVFEKFKNVPIIYGMRLRKKDAVTQSEAGK